MKPYYEDDAVTIFHGDCREILPTLDGSLLLTDPPYGIPKGSAVWRRNGTAIEDWAEQGHNVVVEGWRELVNFNDCWAVEFGLRAGDQFAMAADHSKVGWAPSNVYALVKSAPAPTPRPGFCNAIELALVSRIGKPKWHGTGYVPNRWIGMTPNRAGTSWGHPTEKPSEPLNVLVQALSALGDVVVDPFAGSGTTLRAAKDCGRKAIGVEVNEAYCEIAAKRCAQEVLAL